MNGSPSLLRRHILLQWLVILACWGAGEGAMRALGLRLPGSLPGLAILVVLLATGVVRPASLRAGTQTLLADMLLFFVPAVPAVIAHPEFLGWLGLRIAVVIALGTVAVMAITGFVVDWACRWRDGADV